jgi:tape measure domain-containing protein
MSGVIIDVETNSEAAKRDLQSLNQRLKDMFLGANRTKGALGSIDGSNFKSINKNIKDTTDSFRNFQVSGGSAMSSISKNTHSVVKDIGLLKSAVGATGVALAAFGSIKTFNRMADDLTNVQNRLRLVTNDTDALLRKQRQLFLMSQQTRTSFGATANIFVDFVKGLKQSGIEEERVVKVVKTIQQAGALSGSSMETLNASLVQLSQGIGAGVLRGEELNSVLEGMKYYGQGLAEALGMTTGQLRQFAMDGGLTTKTLIQATEKMAKKTATDFQKTTVTMGAATANFHASVSYFVADINQFLGVSDFFAKGLNKRANLLAGASDNIITQLTLIRRAAKNYIDEIVRGNTFVATLKGVIKLNINPLDAVSKYQQQKKVKEYLRKVHDFFAKETDVDVNVKPTGLEKLFSRFKIPKADNEDASRRLTDVKTMRQRVEEVINLSTAMYDTLSVTARNTLHLFPQIQLPMTRYADSLKRFVSFAGVNIDSWVANTIRPASRAVEGLQETLSIFSSGDKRLERAWVSLFKSSNIVEFTENLFKLNRARESLKLDDKAFLGHAFLERLGQASKGIDNVLIKLGFMKNRFRIKVPVEDIKKQVEATGSVIQRVWEDVFAPKLDPILRKTAIQIKTFGATLSNTLAASFTLSNGRDLGESFGRLIGLGVRKVVSGFKFLEGASFGDLLNTSAIKKFVSAVEGPLEHLKNFFKGFFKGILGGFGAEANKGNFLTKTFDQISEEADSKLKHVERRIRDFGKSVKGVFYDIWDAVVGHSFWPDTIDGVVSYTHRIFESNKTLKKFKDNVLDMFKSVYERMKSSEFFGDFARKLGKIDWSAALKTLTGSVGSALVAGMLLFFGNLQMKLTALSYFISLFNVAIGGAVSTITPHIATLMGTVGGQFAERLLEGAVRSLDALIGAIPSFVHSFLNALLPAQGIVDAIFALSPVASNHLLWAIGAIALLSTKVKALKPINEMIFGKKKLGKDGIKVISEGILPVFQQMTFGWIGELLGKGAVDGLEKASKDLPKVLFKDSKLALAGAAALSAAMLDSVSIFEASFVGVPLLATAILGPKGGVRFVKDVQSTLISTVKGVFSIISTIVAKEASKNNLLAGTFLDISVIVASLTGKMTKGASPIKKAFGALFRDLFSIPRNLSRNSDAYAEGSMSLLDAMFTLDDGKKVALRKSFKGAVNSVLTGDLGRGNSFKDYFKTISTNFAVGVAGLRAHFSSLKGVGTKLTQGLSVAFEVMSNRIGRALRLLGDGLSVFAGILKNKFALVSLFFLLMATVAHAATSTSGAIGDMSHSLLGLAGAVGTVVAALGTLGVSVRTLRAFQSGKDSFKADAIRKSMDAFESDRRARKARELAEFAAAIPRGSVHRQRDINRHDKRLEGGVQRDLDIKLATLNKTGAAGSTLAGIQSASAYLGTFYKGVSDLTSQSALNPAWWTRLVSPIKNVGGAFRGVSAAAKVNSFASTVASASELGKVLGGLADGKGFRLGKLTDVFKGIGSVGGAAFKDVGKAISTMTVGLASSGGVIRAFGAVITAVMTAITDGIWAAVTALTTLIAEALAPFLPIIATIGAIVGVVGVLGLWLFGPGNSFLDNLEWAWDKIRSIFGMEAKSDTGRRSAIEKMLGDQQIGNTKISFKDAIASTDFEGMSEETFGVVTEQAKETAEAFANLRKEIIKQGYGPTDSQRNEAKRLEEEQKRLLARQAPKKPEDFNKQTEEMLKSFSKVDNSHWAVLKRFSGWHPSMTRQDIESDPFFAINTTAKRAGQGIELFVKTLASSPRILFNAVVGSIPILVKIIGDKLNDAFSKLKAYILSIDWVRERVVPALKTVGDGINDIGDKIGEKFLSLFDRFSPEEQKYQRGFKSSRDRVSTLENLLPEEKQRFDAASIRARNADVALNELNRRGARGYIKTADGRTQLESADQFDKRRDAAKANKALDELNRRGARGYIKTADGRTQLESADQFEKRRDAIQKEAAKANKALDELNRRGARGGRTQLESADQFEKRRDAIQKEAAEANKALDEMSRKLAVLDARRKKAQVFQTAFNLGAKNIKDTLGIDFGTDSKDFVGTQRDWDILQKSREKVFELDKDIANTNDRILKATDGITSINERRLKTAQRLSEIAFDESKAEQNKQLQLLGTASDYLGNLGKTSASSVQAQLAVDPGTFAQFTEAAKAYDDLNNRLKTFDYIQPDASKKFNQLTEDLAKAGKGLTDLSPKTVTLEDINNRLQQFNIPQFSTSQYLYISPQHIVDLNSKFNAITNAQIDLDKVIKQGWDGSKASLDRYKNALANVDVTTRALKSATATTLAQSIKDAIDQKGAGSIEAARAAGLEDNNYVFGNKKRRELVTKLTSKKADADAVKYDPNATEEQITKAAATSAKLETQIGELSSSKAENKMAATFNDLLQSLNNVGVAVDALSFSKLRKSARDSLTSIGYDLAKIDKRLEKAKPGADLASMFEERAKLYAKARDLLLETLHNTGKGIMEGLSRLGLSEASVIGRMKAEQISNLLEIDRRVEGFKLQLADTTDLEEIVKLNQAIAKAEAARDKAIVDTNSSFERRLESINDVFKTSLDQVDYSFFGDELTKRLFNISAITKKALIDFYQTGQSVLGNTAQTFFETLRRLGQKGEIISIFQTWSDGMAKALERGAESGFSKFKEVFSGATFDDYLGLGKARRTAITQELASKDAIKSILDSPGASDDMVKTINTMYGAQGKTATETIQALQNLPGFDDQFKKLLPPTEQLTGSLGKATGAINELTKAIRGEPSTATVPVKPTPGTTEVKGVVVTGTRQKSTPITLQPRTVDPTDEAYRRAHDTSDIERSILSDITNANGLRAGIRNATSMNGMRIDQSTLNLASDVQLKKLASLSEAHTTMQDDLNRQLRGESSLTGLDITQLQKSITIVDESFQQLATSIEQDAYRVSNAGKELSASFRDTFSSGLKDLLKGKSSLKDFGKSLLDNITSSIVDKSVDGFTSNFTKDGGFLDKGLQSLGQMVFGGGGGKTGDGTGDLLSSLGGLFGVGSTGNTNVMSGDQPSFNPFGDILGKSFNLGSLFGGSSDSKLTTDLTKPLNSVSGVFTDASSVIDTTFPELTNTIGKAMPDLTKTLTDCFGAGASGSGGGIMSSLGSFFGGGGGGLSSLFSSGGSGPWGFLGTLFGTAIAGGFAGGGEIRGPGTGKSDSMLAAVSNGEFVTNEVATRKNLPLLKAINSGKFKLGKMPHFAKGGLVSQSLIAPMPVSSLEAAKAPPRKDRGDTHVHLQVIGDVSRQTKSTIIQMLPNIAEGVNSHNREKGYK